MLLHTHQMQAPSLLVMLLLAPMQLQLLLWLILMLEVFLLQAQMRI